MKSLFEQFEGTYQKESDYDIPNLEMPDTENFEIRIYGQRHRRIANAAVYLRKWKNSSMYDKIENTYTGIG